MKNLRSPVSRQEAMESVIRKEKKVYGGNDFTVSFKIAYDLLLLSARLLCMNHLCKSAKKEVAI